MVIGWKSFLHKIKWADMAFGCICLLIWDKENAWRKMYIKQEGGEMTMGSFRIGGITFGIGKPKVCIPIVKQTAKEIKKEAKSLQDFPCDIIEVRLDYYEDGKNQEAVVALLTEVKQLLKKPIIATFRSKEQGGILSISKETYESLLTAIMLHQVTDLIDIEYSCGEERIKRLIQCAKDNQIGTILSSHDFVGTPKKEEIIALLKTMQQLGADLPKLAVMPQTEQDVLSLMEATIELKQYNKTPIITMSMGRLGMISRISGGFTGSAMTFAMHEEASAPGQIPCKELNQILSLLE